MPSNNAEQYRFGNDGKLEEPDDEDEDGPALNDWGEPLGRFGTKCGESMFLVSSALQKGARRGHVALSCWAAWELVRSGYENHCWNRLNTIALEDTASHDPVTLLVHRYEEMAGEYGPKEWAAMEAAMALARAESSREADWARVWFEAVAEEWVKDDAEDKYSFPTIPPEARDKHTQEGSRMGRDMGHFILHSSRVTDESELGQEWKRRIIEHEGFADDEEAIEQAVANVEPGEHDDPPEGPNQSLSECGTNDSPT